MGDVLIPPWLFTRHFSYGLPFPREYMKVGWKVHMMTSYLLLMTVFHKLNPSTAKPTKCGSVWTTMWTMLKNTPHLVTFHERIIVCLWNFQLDPCTSGFNRFILIYCFSRRKRLFNKIHLTVSCVFFEFRLYYKLVPFQLFFFENVRSVDQTPSVKFVF